MAATPALRVSEVLEQYGSCLEQYGSCLELVPMDAHFQGISVGLYARDGVFTVWSFSRKPGVQERIKAIRDQLVSLGGLASVPGAPNQAVFPCGFFHQRLIKFLLAQAVGKTPDYSPPRARCPSGTPGPG